MKISILIIIFINLINSASLPFPNWQSSNQFAISSTSQTKKQQYESLKEEKEELEKTDKDFDRDIKLEQNKTKKNIQSTQEAMKDSVVDRDFLLKKLGILNDANQSFLDAQLSRKELVSVIQEHQDLLEEYFKDPTFKFFRIVVKASYGYEEIIELYKKIANQEEIKARLIDEKRTLENDLDIKKKNLSEIIAALKNKEKAQKEFNFSEEQTDANNLKLRQKAELLDLEKNLLEAQKILAELKIKETQNKLSYLQSQLWLTESKLKLFKQDLLVVERSFWVDIKDINRIQETYEKNKQSASKQIAIFSEKINTLSQQEEKKRKEFETLAKEYNIELNDMNSLIDWTVDANKISAESVVYELGLINDQKILTDLEIKQAEVQKELEKIKLNSDSILLKIITTWFNLNHKKLNTQNEITQEISKYEIDKAELERLLNSYKEKSNLASSLIATQTRSLQNLKERIGYIQSQKEEYTNKYGAETYKKILNILGRAEGSINKQIDVNSKIIKTYFQLKSIAQDQLKQIDAIIKKLNKFGGVLQRSDSALSIRGLKNIGPEIKNFLKDLQTIFLSYISQFEITSILSLLKEKNSWLMILALFIIFLLIGVMHSFVNHVSPRAYKLFLYKSYKNKWVLYIMRALGILFQICQKHFFSIASWILIFALIESNWMLNVGFIVLFYITSIPYLCYLIFKFLNLLAEYKEGNNHIFISSPFKRRLLLVLGLIGCSTIIITFINNAYNAVTTGRSDFTLLLQGMLRIIIQLCLLLLVGKEEILSVIPQNNNINRAIYNFVKDYYYILITFIISIMILSDPQIGGWGKLVNFVLFGLIMTGILIAITYWAQKYLREASYKLFFVPNSEQLLKERFQYAKAWYGLFLFLSFVGLILFLAYFGSSVWGYSLSFDKIKHFMNTELFWIKTPDPTNPQKTILQAFNLFSLLIIFGFIFAGLLFAWAFEKFILQRIFGVLFVDPGVQNTVSKIGRYFIIILFFILGLLKVDLGASIFYFLGLILIGIAWALKEPVNDVIAYFTILVERSIKIGDYIELADTEKRVVGVVRKINLRTVVLRRNNSVSVVVPNSVITNNTVYNWNYVSGFFAFPDIILTVNYQANPQEVREIIAQVLEENGNVLRRPEPIIRLEEFSVNGYTFLIRAFLTSNKVLEQWDIASSIRFALAINLNKAGIRICTPARLITIDNGQLTNDSNKIKEGA